MLELLKRETDDASKARLAKLDEEIVELRATASTLRAQWEGEKGLMDEIGTLTDTFNRMADRILVLEDGRITHDGPAMPETH